MPRGGLVMQNRQGGHVICKVPGVAKELWGSKSTHKKNAGIFNHRSTKCCQPPRNRSSRNEGVTHQGLETWKWLLVCDCQTPSVSSEGPKQILKTCGPTRSFHLVSLPMRPVLAELLLQWGRTRLLLLPPDSGFKATPSLYYVENTEDI